MPTLLETRADLVEVIRGCRAELRLAEAHMAPDHEKTVIQERLRHWEDLYHMSTELSGE